MKKVFLSLAVIAALTVVSCKQAEAPADATAVDSTAVAVDTAAVAPAADTAAVAVDSAAATPAAPAAEVKK